VISRIFLRVTSGSIFRFCRDDCLAAVPVSIYLVNGRTRGSAECGQVRYSELTYAGGHLPAPAISCCQLALSSAYSTSPNWSPSIG
jgi:hypothetical protein